MGLHPISIAEALENPILISIDNASSEKLPRVQAALKLVSFDHQKTEKMLSIHLLCSHVSWEEPCPLYLVSLLFPIFRSRRLTTAVSNVIVTDNKISSKVNTTDNNSVRSNTLVVIPYSLSQKNCTVLK